MPDSVQAAIVSGGLSATVTAFVIYLATIAKIKKDLEATYDRDLRDKRLEVYKELWKHREPLAQYARPHPFLWLLPKISGRL